MVASTTWAVLGDGRYIRIMVDEGAGNHLLTLKADDVEPLARLCYELITRKAPLTSEVPGERSYCKLVADFLTEQHAANAFGSLVIAAPAEVLKALRDALPDELNRVVAGELAEDILAKSSNEIRDIIQSTAATQPPPA